MQTGRQFLPKCWYPSTLHSAMSQNTTILIFTAVRASNFVNIFEHKLQDSIQLRKFWLPSIKTYQDICKVAAYSYITFAVHTVTLFTYFQSNCFQERNLLLLALLHTYHNYSYYFGDYCLLGCDAMQSGRKVPMFWKNLLLQTLGYQTVQRHITEDSNLQSHHCINLKSHISYFYCSI
jgi:hypothetical protein